MKSVSTVKVNFLSVLRQIYHCAPSRLVFFNAQWSDFGRGGKNIFAQNFLILKTGDEVLANKDVHFCIEG
jgi:hypothetical protein